MKVAVLGASADPSRYAYKAAERLRARGHEVIGVNPRLPDLGAIPVVATVRELPPDLHTLTVYLAPERSALLGADLDALAVRRVIFNPGAEHDALAARFAARGVQVLEACTLVLLATGAFERDEPGDHGEP